MHNKCNTLESFPNHPLLPSVEKSSFLKLVPWAKKVVLGQWKPRGLRVWIPLPPLACCVIPGKSFNLPDPQSLYLYYRDGYSCFTGQLWGQESTCVESLVVGGGGCPAQWDTRGKYRRYQRYSDGFCIQGLCSLPTYASLPGGSHVLLPRFPIPLAITPQVS